MLKLLLVEDNALLRASLADALSGHDVQVVAACATASEAVEELRRGTLDVLVTDLDLGEGPDGITLAHVVRRLHPTASGISRSQTTAWGHRVARQGLARR